MPLRAQVEARFEVLPVSDGLLLRPRSPMDGIRALEVRDGQLAIDGREAEIDDLARRIGADAAAPVRALLELDPDELSELFGLSSALPEPDTGMAPGGSERERLETEMAARRREIEREQEQIRQRIEEEMARHADDVQRRQEDLAREIERMARRGHRRDSDARVVMGTPVHVDKGETTGDVVAIGASVDVDGEVMGDAVSVGGSETIDGLVTGSVVSVGGSVHLGPNARVMQDVVSVGGTVQKAPGAEVMGQVTEVSFWQGMTGGWFGGLGHGWDIDFDRGHRTYFDGALLHFLRTVIFVLVLILFGALATVVARNPLERMSAAAGAEPWKAGVIGLLAVIGFVPAIAIVAVLLAVSIVGIPLLLLWPFAVLACVFAAFFGYLAAAHALARWSELRFGWRVRGPGMTIVLGLFLLHGAWLMARLVDVVDSPRDIGGFLRLMLMLFWLLVNLCAAFVGVGGLLLARRGGPAPATALAAPPPPAPTSPGPRTHEPPAPAEGPAAESASAEEPGWEEPFAGLDEPEGGEEGEGGEGEGEAPEAEKQPA
jgi:hypothetical protein